MKTRSIEDRVAEIEKRNAAVELNKAWETSMTRKLGIAVSTYIISGVFFALTDLTSRPWLSAFVPAGGYLLSTPSLKALRTIWERKGKID